MVFYPIGDNYQIRGVLKSVAPGDEGRPARWYL